jgi:amidase
MPEDRAPEESPEAKAGLDRRTVLTIAGGAAAAAVGGAAWMETSSQTRPSQIVMMNAVELSDAIKSKQVSCVEVMNAYLDHIARLNPKVNAIVSLQPRDGLLAQAKERDAQLARGEYLGWMHGFPQAIKDLAAAKGLPMTQGSPLLKDFIAPNDSIHVERVKNAGAIIIGKTNAPEFGLGSQTFNPVFGTTYNAYDQSKTAGGSTGGGAVALALRMLPVADGSDHGGSLRNPGAFNNVFGLRPSFGRVPSESADAFTGALSVNGPMARDVPDLAMLLSVQAGYDPRAPLSNHQDPKQFTESLKRDFKGKAVAWLGDMSGYLPFEPGVLDLCKSGLRVLSALGCIVEEDTPEFTNERVWNNWTKLRAWQSGWPLLPFYNDPSKRALLKPEAQFEVENWLKLTPSDIVSASEVRTAWYQTMRNFLERYDYVVLPSAQVFPFDAKTPWPKEIAGRSMETYYRWMDVCVQVTMSGSPAVNVPVGFSANGLPMGMQIVGPNHSELACLQLAYAYDQATNWVEKRKPALLGA